MSKKNQPVSPVKEVETDTQPVSPVETVETDTQSIPPVKEVETDTQPVSPVEEKQETKTKIRFTRLVLHKGQNYVTGNTLEVDEEELESIPKAWYEVVES